MAKTGGKNPSQTAYWLLDEETGEVIDYDYPHD